MSESGDFQQFLQVFKLDPTRY